ncbi:type II toxin-antitoxin system RelB family antitoxin [Selenomonas sp. F0473]|uniref:type II toxin-antitoxin system RelB family antitoxin n=1 Tax=Selenomonas sp. F0473 TaxID=999423 RepID=UPI00029EBE5A|nr:DUF6290 family protein [Selenomonas sp. F0473]EKU71205.1 hypothetical protein HMPREF9161_01299 [Selenomonas sp. F0473]
MAVIVELTGEEERLAQSYAKIHGTSVEEAMKRNFFEMIEDEYDAAVADAAYEEYVKSGKKSRPIEELWEELGL